MISDLELHEKKILKTRDFISIHDNIYEFFQRIYYIKLEEGIKISFIYRLKGSPMSGITTYLKLLYYSFKEKFPNYFENQNNRVKKRFEIIFINNNDCLEEKLIINKTISILYFIDGKHLNNETKRKIILYYDKYSSSPYHIMILVGLQEGYKLKDKVSSNLFKIGSHINPNIEEIFCKEFKSVYLEYALEQIPTKILGRLNSNTTYFKNKSNKSLYEIPWKVLENILYEFFKLKKMQKKIRKCHLQLFKQLAYKNPFKFNNNIIKKEIKELNIPKNGTREYFIKVGLSLDLIRKESNRYLITNYGISATLFGRKKRGALKELEHFQNKEKVNKKIKEKLFERGLKELLNKEIEIIKKLPRSFIISYFSGIKRIRKKSQKALNLHLSKFLIKNKIALSPYLVDKLIKEGVFIEEDIGKTITLTTSKGNHLDIHALAKYEQYQQIYDALLENRIDPITSLKTRLPNNEELKDITIIVNAILQIETIPFDDNKILLRDLKNSKFYKRIKVNNSKRKYQMINFVFFSTIHIYLDNSIDPLKKSNLTNELFFIGQKNNEKKFYYFLKNAGNYLFYSSYEKRKIAKENYFGVHFIHHGGCLVNHLNNINSFKGFLKTRPNTTHEILNNLNLLSKKNKINEDFFVKIPHIVISFGVYNEFEDQGNEPSVFFYRFIYLMLAKRIYLFPNFNIPYEYVYMEPPCEPNFSISKDIKTLVSKLDYDVIEDGIKKMNYEETSLDYYSLQFTRSIHESIVKYNTNNKKTPLKLLYFKTGLSNYENVLITVTPICENLKIDKLYVCKFSNGALVMTRGCSFNRGVIKICYVQRHEMQLLDGFYESLKHDSFVYFKVFLEKNKGKIETLDHKSKDFGVCDLIQNKYVIKLKKEFIRKKEISSYRKNYYYFLFSYYLPRFLGDITGMKKICIEENK